MNAKRIMKAIGLITLFSASADAFFRMPCGQNLVTERIDPLISPGAVSAHVHQVSGGNGFGFTTDFADTQKSTCTTCEAAADHSNYWTPILYYKDQNGNFTKVDQNGMTVYYLQRGDTSNITAFPEGFRMIAGDPFKRSATSDFASTAISFVCLDYAGTGAAGQYGTLPTHNCPDGVRAQVFFPACWDGVNLDSSDHKSHVVYYESGTNDNGVCPSSHPVQLISIFYEVIFSTDKHAFWNGDYGTNQPFVFAQGDPTGAGFHGDFINGWDVSILQQAVNTCTALSGTMEDCHALQLQTGAQMSQCTIPVSVEEDITGPFPQLPGCNPVTAGPGEATPVTNCAKTEISAPQVPFTDVSSKSWSYQGCATDDVNARTLTGTSNIYSTVQTATDVDTCIMACTGYQYMGLEYGKQCFCGNSVATDRMPQASLLGSCNLPCAGNSSQICGGGSQLSLYKACPAGTTCTNSGGYTAIGNLGGGGATNGSSSSAIPTAASSSIALPASSSTALSVSQAVSAISDSGPSSGSAAATSAAEMPIASYGGSAPASSVTAAPDTTTSAGPGKVIATSTSISTDAAGKVHTVTVTATEIEYVTKYITIKGPRPTGAAKHRRAHAAAHAKKAIA